MTSNCELQGVVYNGKHGYSSGMENSRKVVRTAIKQILQCVDNLMKSEHDQSRTISIAEFGAADGGVSLELMEAVIDHINQTSSGIRDITIVYEDQLFNDFNVLFKTVNEHRRKMQSMKKHMYLGVPGSNPNLKDCRHYIYNVLIDPSNEMRAIVGSDMCMELSANDNVHILASATSMYRICLPTGSVDLAFSSMANQWLSKKPCDINDGVFQDDCNNDELESFRQQWQIDWQQFLWCRAKELREGGYLAVISFLTDENGRRNEHAGEDSYHIFSSIWKEFQQTGKISEEEYINTSCVTYIPTEADLVQPFHTDMNGYLTLVSCSQKTVEILPCPPNNTSIEDREMFVDRSLCCIKPWLYNILVSGLSPDRTDADKERLLDVYFKMLRNILMQMTTFCPVIYRTACVIAKRT